MRSTFVIGLTTSVALLVGGAGIAAAGGKSDVAGVRRDLPDVRRATVAHHDVAAAERHGYGRLLDCFDSEAGGMGQHYVDQNALDGVVEATHPEAMVYEVAGDRLKLVAVEYIVPSPFVDPADPPELFGTDFHHNHALDLWVLHAWIWRGNPTGVFEDFNPNVGPCPA